MMVHREITRKHVPREAYLVSRRHRSDALIPSYVSRFTNDASQTRAANPQLQQKDHDPCELGGPYVFLEQFEHSLVYWPVTGHQLSLVNRVRASCEIRHSATGFAENDDSRRHVPRVQRHLPKSIEPAGGDIA